MNALDVVFGIVLLYGLIKGIFRGFILEAASFIGVVSGIYIANIFDENVAQYIGEYCDLSSRFSQPIAFFLIFAAIVVLCHFVAKIIDKAAKMMMLGWLNKLLGATFSLLKYAFIISILLNVIQAIDSRDKLISLDKKACSHLYLPLKNLAPTAMPYIDETDFNIENATEKFSTK
ncbi:MAG: CvpA family protein [Prevotellaceae bacterium]|jgi:membrane protein required for colicin V production|nr:CvpA family protein [Prevotellaceae bacterium]